MIPLSKVRSVGLRRVIDEDCVGQVVRILRTRTVKRDNQTWNRRYRAYLEKIKTGSVLDIAEVLRDLYQLKYSKTLSFGERKMLDTARSLLVREISVARGEEVDDVEEEMDDIFRDCIENSVDAQRNAA
jgi:CarD family transcriptional regulator